MFSFFKKDPLHEKLKQAKKAKKVRDKWDKKERARKDKNEKRILTFLLNKICPVCGSPVKLTTKVIKNGKNHCFECTEVVCYFTKHYYTSRKGKLLI